MERLDRIISPEEGGRTVRSIMKFRMGFSSHAIARICRRSGGILVDGQPAFTSAVLSAGQTLSVLAEDTRAPKASPVPGDWPLEIVWEDQWLFVLNKPAGMTSHASNFLPDTPTVAGALAWQRGGNSLFHPVNRLDKGTTGLMVVAKSGYVHNLLRQSLHTEGFYREYRGICLGCPAPEEGTVDAPIGRDETSAVARKIRADGARAVTRYRVLERTARFSLLCLVPETGRTHQLRLHMASLGHPLAGDWLYGTEDRDLISRPALHSYALNLTHPITGEELSLTAPMPEDMRRVLGENQSNGGTNMLTWNVSYHCKPGQRDAFYRALLDLGVRANSLGEEGNRGYDYYFSAEDPDCLLLVESWTEPAMQERHCGTELFARLQALKTEYVAEVTIDKFNF